MVYEHNLCQFRWRYAQSSCVSVPGAWRRNESLWWRLIDDRHRPIGSSGLVWVLLSGRVRSLFTCFMNSSMVLIGLGSMNGTSSEHFWANPIHIHMHTSRAALNTYKNIKCFLHQIKYKHITIKVTGVKKEKVKPVKEKKEAEAFFVNHTQRSRKRCIVVLFTWLSILILSFCIDILQPMASGYNPILAESAWYNWWEAQGSLHSRLMKMDHLRMPVKALSLFPHCHQMLLGLWTLNTA